ncbi:MAG: hypothetical protein H6Q15_2049 [Bacteroidetes bacterium]|nr:hypothetical protein [Bacteroidota bacterium]
MSRKAFIAFVVFSILSLNSGAQEKEKRFGIELSSGPSVFSGKLTGATLNPGYGFEGTLQYRIIQYTDVYLGWGWNYFGNGSIFAGNNAVFKDNGYVLGFQFVHPVMEPVSLFVRAGAVYNHIEVDGESGILLYDFGRGFGFQFATGIGVGLSSDWNLNFGIKLNSIIKKTVIEDISSNLNLNLLLVQISIIKRF